MVALGRRLRGEDLWCRPLHSQQRDLLFLAMQTETVVAELLLLSEAGIIFERLLHD